VKLDAVQADLTKMGNETIPTAVKAAGVALL
jgi:hypothetical protein